jgi:CHAD domain-containing protein
MTFLSPFQKSYERRVRIFEDFFALSSASPSSGAIHDTRVGLKRLRAFFDLVGSMDAGFDAEERFAPARRLFRAAGRVRNLQVIEAKVRDASAEASLELAEYYNWLKQEERGGVRKFSRICRHFEKDFFASVWTKMARALDGVPAGRIRKKIEVRFVDLVREIKQERAMPRDVRRLHFLRTRTKEAHYTLEILLECGLTGEDAALLGERLRDVHQSLGRWHDEEIILGSLEHFRRRRDPGPLVSFKSYVAFARRTKDRKSEELARFEAAWSALREFLGRGYGRRVLYPPSPRYEPAAEPPERSQ